MYQFFNLFDFPPKEPCIVIPMADEPFSLSLDGLLDLLDRLLSFGLILFFEEGILASRIRISG